MTDCCVVILPLVLLVTNKFSLSLSQVTPTISSVYQNKPVFSASTQTVETFLPLTLPSKRDINYFYSNELNSNLKNQFFFFFYYVHIFCW